MGDTRVVTAAGAPPAAGPYSQAIVCGDLVFCSGQVGLDPATGELAGKSVTEQTRRALANLAAVLEAAGARPSDVVKTTCFLTDMDDFAEFNDAYAGFFGARPPARSTVGVAALPLGARVEIECVARLGG
jgi:2-iminobutanoate/2-iminopropanoate deaminase